MKKFTIGLLISIISLSSFACEIDSAGRCGTTAFFQTRNFDVNSKFQIRVNTGDSTYEFDYFTSWTSTDTLFTVQLSGNNQAEVQFRYKNRDSSDAGYNPWGTLSNPGNWVLSSINSVCGLLPVTFQNFSIQRTDANDIKFQFKYNTKADYYNLLVSDDARNWKVIARINPNNTGEYKGSVSLIAGTLVLGLFFISFAGEKRIRGRIPTKVRRLKTILIIALFFFIACKKESESKQNYKFAKVQAVTQIALIESEVKSF